MKKIALITLAIILLALVAPVATSFATTPTPDTKEGIQHLKDLEFDVTKTLNLGGQGENADQGQAYFEEGKNPIVEFILRVINFALTVIGSIAMIILIIGGFMMMTSQGNQQKLDEAKDVVKYALIGIVVTFMSYVIVIFVQSLFIDN